MNQTILQTLFQDNPEIPVEISSFCNHIPEYVQAELAYNRAARELMALCLAYAGQYYKQCYIETLHNMTAANRFYQKWGFRRLDRPLLDTGHFSCDVWYIKDLEETVCCG